jgi:hypothetical protein
MPPALTAKTPRYRIESVKGELFDTFKQRKNAIRGAVRMAIEYPGATFLVIKMVNLKSKVIFRVKIEVDFEFEDVQDMYSGLIQVYQKKLDKTKYWRKSE